MVKKQVGQDAVPDVEILGEWDHGVADPVAEGGADGLTSKHQFEEALKNAKTAVVHAEQNLKGAIQTIIHTSADGMKCPPDVEALGEWDHGINDPETQDNNVDGGGPVKALQKIKKTIIDSIDEQTKQELTNHTEEELIGAKLCVKELIHEDSFTAPS